MEFNDIETKLINLALNHAAHEGEFANAAAMLIKQLRKRGVTAQQFVASNPSSRFGFSFSSDNGNGSMYESLYRTASARAEGYRTEIDRLQADKTKLHAEIIDLRTKYTKAVSDVEAAKQYGGLQKAAPKPKGKYFGGILLTEKEVLLFIRIATYYPTRVANGDFGSTVWHICRNNSEQGTVQGLIKKGLVAKSFTKGLRLTDAGIAHFRQYHHKPSDSTAS